MSWAAYRVAEQRDAVVAELERELENRGRVFPDRVGKGRMTEQEADYQLAIWREILDNVAQGLGASWHVDGLRFPWLDKVKALNRELDYRQRLFPDWIAKGRLDQATADRRVELIEMVRDLYWRHMFAYWVADGPANEYLVALRNGPWTGGKAGAGKLVDGSTKDAIQNHPGRRALHALVDQHIQVIDAEDAQQQQELLL